METQPKNGTVLALGNFDGVHIAHAKLLQTAARTAAEERLLFGVYTFRTNTKTALGINRHGLLTTPEERKRRLYACGAEMIYEEDFDAVRDMEPSAFVPYLINRFAAGALVCGDNFTFGRGAAGTSRDLVRFAREQNINVTVLPTEYLDGVPVSAGAIRAYIAAGDIEKASAMLGRRYALTAEVVPDRQIGRTLGFPTINQPFAHGVCLPRRGVYAVECAFGGEVKQGVCNVGIRPTFGDISDVIAETHLFDFDGELYGTTVTTSFLQFIRDERRFASPDALTVQLKADADAARRFFGNTGR